VDKKPKLLLVGSKWNHMGGHSGLSPLASALSSYFAVDRVEPTRFDRVHALVRRCVSMVRKLAGLKVAAPWTPFYHTDHALMEAAAIRRAKREPFDWIAIESLEDVYVRFDQMRDHLPPHSRIMAISHQPPAWWKLFVTNTKDLGRLDAVIALSADAQRYLSNALNKPVHFLRHGVDHAFFHPPAKRSLQPSETVHILFCGQWLRDFDTLADIVAKTQAAGIDAIFHLVVPKATRDGSSRYRLAYQANTRWYAGISDDALLNLYHSCHFLVLPLIDATANNSVVEAMSCALPILVSPVGGVPDYVDDDIATFLHQDVNIAVATLKSCIDNYADCLLKSARARERVCQSVNWQQFASGVHQLATGGE